jgi:putative hemolysin
MPLQLAVSFPSLVLHHRDLTLRLAEDIDDRRHCYQLRFQVFNVELREGTDNAYTTGEDCDAFDPICDHLLVEHQPSGQVVGTYRLQSGPIAALNNGYYSEQEFDFRPFESLRSQTIELGRACIHPMFRTYDTLNLLWHGISRYVLDRGSRYLIGCSSLHTQNVAEGWAMLERLRKHLAPAKLQTRPTLEYQLPCLTRSWQGELPEPPKLLRMYLMLGAYICGEPAIDRQFKTIDFLTLLDLERLAPSFRSRFLKKA